MQSERRRLEMARERVLTLYLIWLDKLALWRAHPLGEHHIRYAQARVEYWSARLVAIERELAVPDDEAEEAAG